MTLGTEADSAGGAARAARPRLAEALAGAMRGEVAFDAGTRAVYATDSSNYRHIPIGVAFPVDEADVVAALRVCAAFDVPVLARGAGTSLAGQAVNVAVILDTSRHMTRILELDPERRVARVQPGVVLDDLRAETERFGLTFGPDPATHAWCTLGGMIGNNACGSHSVYTGKTVDNVDRLRLALYGGELIDVGADPAPRPSHAAPRPSDVAAHAPGAPDGRDLVPGAMLDALRSIATRYGPLIRERYPDIPRRVSGYNLDQLLPDAGFHVARALVGTESTCGIVTEATVRLQASPRHRRLVVLGYPDIFAAADAVPSLTTHPLLALEGFDGALIDQMRARNLNTEHLPLLPDGRGWLLAELGADTDAEADALTDRFIASLPAAVHRVRYDDRARQQRLWLIRESGLAAMAFRPDGTPNHEGWEDAAVPPARLGEYLRGITALWAEHGYTGSWSGHFGQGCVHTRNNFELASVAGRASFRRYVERAADLVVSLGGSLSGEHGDGQARGELLGRMYGPALVGAFAEFKAVFDPRGRMNPGILVHPRPLDEDLRYGPGHRPSSLGPSIMTFPHGGRSLQVAAERCVGVGRCRRDDTGAMCPSYRATRDERHSTRGRAKMLAELFQGEATDASWDNRDVRDALDLCLACKACAVDCPTQVDMAAYKAEFNAHHYRRRLRPRAMYGFALLPTLLRIGTRSRRLSNVLLGAPVVGSLGRRVAGVTRARPAPRIAGQPFRRNAAMAQGRRDRRDATVVLWPDTFTDAFRPSVAEDLVAVLERVGERVAIPSAWACCGRTMYDAGFLGLASRNLARLLDVLDPWTSRGIPVIVPEPSCLASFRDELPALLPDDPRAARAASLARSPAEHLLATGPFADEAPGGVPGPDRGRVLVHPHCHGRAIGTPGPDVLLLRRAGYRPELADAGCCGLAGSFGYREEHEALSRRIGTEQWLPRLHAQLAGEEPATLVIDGFSCETQLAHLSDLRSTTLVRLIRDALDA